MHRPPSPPSLPALASTRNQILFTGLIGLVAYSLRYIPGLPFGRPFYYLGLLSGIVHLMTYLFTPRLTRKSITALFIFNTLLLGGVVHFTGGIISPFLFIFFCIIVSASAQDLYPVFNLFFTLAVFLFVVGIEFSKSVHIWSISTQEIYSSKQASLLVTITIIGFMILSGLIYRVILTYLKTQVELEQSLKQNYMNQLSKLDASSQIGLLVNKIVHDIRGPLGAVTGFIKLFQDEPNLTSQTREDCVVILNELDRISRLVNHMLRYTKPGLSLKQELCPVELMETILSVISFHPMARDVHFERQFIKPNTHWIQANKEELQQAYFNILKNALEAMETNDQAKTISIGINIQIPDVAIHIHDNGPGIPGHMLKSLFNETISTKHEGAGVGLVIVREIIQSHGGTVSIDSVPGQGTKILTTLPLKTNEQILSAT